MWNALIPLFRSIVVWGSSMWIISEVTEVIKPEVENITGQKESDASKPADDSAKSRIDNAINNAKKLWKTRLILSMVTALLLLIIFKLLKKFKIKTDLK